MNNNYVRNSIINCILEFRFVILVPTQLNIIYQILHFVGIIQVVKFLWFYRERFKFRYAMTHFWRHPRSIVWRDEHELDISSSYYKAIPREMPTYASSFKTNWCICAYGKRYQENYN